MVILDCKNLAKSFGSLKAVNDLSFSVNEKEILALVGPNGSGKTTAFNLLSKVLKPDSGTVIFAGLRIDGLPPHKICRLGLARTFQVPIFFPTMTVYEQVLLGARFGGKVSGDPKEKVTDALEFVGLAEKARSPTHLLNLYSKKKLMVATALATKPKLLMLDEPLGGLNDQEVSENLALIRKLRESGVATMIIEHNIRAVFTLVDSAIVMNRGEKIAEGHPNEITKNAQVISVYLGEGYM